MKILKCRHLNKLQTHRMKGHSFPTLTKSPLSNFFLKPSAMMSDSMVKFAIKGRLNSLMTGVTRVKVTRNPEDEKCKLCGQSETLHHILNGCRNKKYKFTRRHNEVQSVLRKYLTEKKRVVVHEDKKVRSRDGEPLTGDNSALRPDLYWWNGNRLNIAEFTIPYGMMSEKNGTLESTLTTARQKKTEKYHDLVEDCRRQFDCQVDFYVIIVSSLGAIPNETIEDIQNITMTKKHTAMLACRMVAAALRESMFLYMNYDPRDRNGRNRRDDGNDDTEGHESQESQDEGRDAPGGTDEDSSDSGDDDSIVLDEEVEEEMLHDDARGLWDELIASVEEQEEDNHNETEEDADIEDVTEDVTEDVVEIDVLENPGTVPYWSGRQPSSSNTEDVVQPSSSNDEM